MNAAEEPADLLWLRAGQDVVQESKAVELLNYGGERTWQHPEQQPSSPLLAHQIAGLVQAQDGRLLSGRITFACFKSHPK